MCILQVIDYSGDLEQYYDACDEYWCLKQELSVSHIHIFIFFLLIYSFKCHKVTYVMTRCWSYNVHVWLSRLMVTNVKTC